jgi:hypothetical protein
MSKFSALVLRIAWAAVLCACLTGCFDTQQKITLNPDGTGKVEMESTFALTELLLTQNAQMPAVTAARDFVRKQVEQAQGVDAWKDVSFSEREDGRIAFRGTAYFQDLTKFRMGLSPFLRFAVTKEKNGQLSISPTMDSSAAPISLPATNEPVTAASIQHERKQFRAAQPLLAATMGAMKLETVFHFSGSLRLASNFETNIPNTLRVRFDGTRLVPAVEERLFDPEFARQRIARGTNSSLLKDDHFLNEKLYGQRAPIHAVIAPGTRALFDYAAEVAEARRAFPALATLLGMATTPQQQSKPAVDGALAKVIVTGVGWRFANEETPGVFTGDSGRGYTLSLKADLPGTVMSVNKIEVTRATTLEGDKLEAPRISHHQMSLRGRAPQTNAHFALQLASPPLNSKGLSEVSGFLECSSAENLRQVEVVSGSLRAGAKGAEFGAEIESVGSTISGGWKLVLRSSLETGQLLDIKAVGEDGSVVELEARGQMRVGQQSTSTWLASRPLPRTGKLVADVLVGSQTLRIPFKVTNINLLGQPLMAKQD